MRSWQKYYTNNKKIFWVALSLLTIVVMGLSLGVGVVKISPQQLFLAFTGKDVTSTSARIILYTRLPRTLAAMLSGAALAVSGVVIQTVLHNPLASPGVIGVNSGAGLFVACVCALTPMAQVWTPVIAFAGAFAGVLLVVTLAERTGASRMTVVLAGVAVSQLFSAGIDAVITVVPEALSGVSDFRVGGFAGVTMKQLFPASMLIMISLLVLLSMSHQLEILGLGDDTARSLGVSVKKKRMVFLLLAAALAGAAVSFSGLLGFIGLIVPHVMRRLVGEESLPLLVASSMGGASFVMISDLIARIAFAPYELPVGIVLAFTGAPFFLWLLFRQKGGRV